jgi:GNAT superfamily N-acetyltransferase
MAGGWSDKHGLGRDGRASVCFEVPACARMVPLRYVPERQGLGVSKDAKTMPALPQVGELLRFQRAYYEAISTWSRRPWGVIGLNLDNPSSHDSNHAYVDAPVNADQLAAILREAMAAYAPKGIEPRVRYHVPPHPPDLERHAKALGWSAEVEEETWRAWRAGHRRGQALQLPGLTLSLADAQELEDLLAVHNEGENQATAYRHRQILAALMRRDSVDCLLARLHGEPAGTLACVWRHGWGSIEHVRTRESFRRRGICTAMIGFAQELAAGRGARGLCLCDSVEAADRIYARAGFQLVSHLRQVQLVPAPQSPGPGSG